MTAAPRLGRRTTRIGALIGATVMIAGCAGPRLPSMPDEPGAHPAVSPRQAIVILGAVDAALVRATSGLDAAAAGGRAVGPAREGLVASIAVAKARRRPAVVVPAPTQPRLLLTRMPGWPRWFLAAGPTPASAAPVLRVLQCADARSPYGLWAQLTLLPGATLPEPAATTAGTEPLPATARGLVASPAEVVTRYTDLLNRGTASAFGARFAADGYRMELSQQLRADRKLFSSSRAGQVVTRHTAATAPLFVLPTRDGGALVIARVDQWYAVTLAPRRRAVRLDAQLAALAHRQIVSRRLERRSVEVLAFQVPKAGVSAKISLIAASRVDVAAVGS